MVLVVVATICAVIWMCYRVTALLNIPIPTLVKILGLDLPDAPRVSLHGVSADTITLHWSLPEKAGSVAKHIIQINGINVGESEKRGETSVTVTGLNPDQRYNVRVIAANAQNFQAPGKLIRLRTCPKPGGGGGDSSSIHSNNNSNNKGDSSDDSPSVHSTSHHTHHSHHSNHNTHSSRRLAARERRGSPATTELASHSLHNSHVTQDDQHTVESLTRDLDAVRKEIQETEAQLAHTEEDHKAAEAVLRAELDTLRDKKNEEDAGRQRIRAETKSLEESRRTAEAMRSRTEKALRAKEYDVRKMQVDITRWEEEKLAALGKVEELSHAAEESKENANTTEKELGNDIQETQRQITEMEEEIRSLVAAMKNMETQKEQMKAEEDEEAQKIKEDNEKERLWRDRQRNLEMRYVTVYNAFQAAEIESIRSREMLMCFQGRRESASGSVPDVMQKKPKQRRRNRKSRTHTVSSSNNGYPVHESPSYQEPPAGFNAMQYHQISPTFSNSLPASPFFNIANGTVTGPSEISSTKAGPIMDPYGDSDYINGTPMSPTANSLLPSNLFSFEDAPPSPKASPINDRPHSMSFDAMAFMAPHSPMSSGSVSNSPRSSFNHIPLFSSFSAAPRDLESLERTTSTMSPIGTNRPIGTPVTAPGAEGEAMGAKFSSRRFVNLLSSSFNRQRGKTIEFEGGPALGQLPPSESHTFPKNDPPGLDPIGTRRRSGSHSSWASSLDFLHGTSSRHPPKPLERSDSEHSRRSASFNQFNPSFDPIDPNRLFGRPISPRPSSVTSFDNPLPAPSADASAAFGWPSSGGAGGGGDFIAHHHHGSGQWTDFRNAARLSTPSRPTSRPISPSASTTSLSLYPGFFPGGGSSISAASGRPTTPRLNPAAPTFQSRMDTPSRHGEDENDSDFLHHQRYKDRDSASINTDTSALSGASLEGVSTKESILSRFSLSRKGSTGKFISWSRGNKKAAKAEGEELEEEVADDNDVTPQMQHHHNNKGGLWSGWKKEEHESAGEEEDAGGRGRLTPLAKESSPWMKGNHQSGFFGAIGRAKKEVGGGEEEVIREETGEKKGLGIFTRRKEERE